MAVYYVGLGGNDLNAGTTWATRLLTLNAAEDAHGGGAPKAAIAAGDTVWVAPGVYREMLTCDVSGAAGSPITYIGDVSGEHTDGVGGIVRVTGSDNDQTATRAYCVTCGAQRNYRTFRGFYMDTGSSGIIHGGVNVAGTNWIIEDCTTNGPNGIQAIGNSQSAWVVRRCTVTLGVVNATGHGIQFVGLAAGVQNAGHIVENCMIVGSGTAAVRSDIVGGITIRHCAMMYWAAGVRVATALPAGYTAMNVNNCIIICATSSSLRAINLGELVENYNALEACAARTNVAVGANSNTYPALLDLGILHSGASQVSGFRFPPPLFGTLSQWSQVRAIADTGAATEDILGLTRPVTAGKRSWGAVQYVDMARDTGTVHAGTASKKLADAGRDQIYVPTTNVSTVFSVYVYREANYAGVNPQMIIKQPGQADTIVTDGGAAGAWNLLTTTLTPAALPGYVVIELVSNNTAAAGNYATYFDDLTVT